MLWYGLWTFLGTAVGFAVACIMAPAGRNVFIGGRAARGMCGLLFAIICIPFLMRLWSRRKRKEGEEASLIDYCLGEVWR